MTSKIKELVREKEREREIEIKCEKERRKIYKIFNA